MRFHGLPAGPPPEIDPRPRQGIHIANRQIQAEGFPGDPLDRVQGGVGNRPFEGISACVGGPQYPSALDVRLRWIHEGVADG